MKVVSQIINLESGNMVGILLKKTLVIPNRQIQCI